MHLSCSLCSFWTWFLTCPLWYFDRCFSRWCRKLWLSRSLQSIDGRRHSLRSAEAEPHGPDSAVATRFSVVDVPAVLVVQILRCCRGEDRVSSCRQAQMLGILPVWLHRTVMPRHSCAWLVLLVTTQLALCRSDVCGGFWKNLLYFLRVRGPRSRGRF